MMDWGEWERDVPMTMGTMNDLVIVNSFGFLKGMEWNIQIEWKRNRGEPYAASIIRLPIGT